MKMLMITVNKTKYEMNTGQASGNVNEYRKNKEYKIPARQVCQCSSPHSGKQTLSQPEDL